MKGSLLIFLIKMCTRLHFGARVRSLIYWCIKITDNGGKSEMTSEGAEQLLQKIHSDPSFSALCQNRIVKPVKYDLQVIIPVYKVEKFLEGCLVSVLLQQTKYSYHIVAINDGSPDKCDEILQRYAEDRRVTVITQENKGFSGARNAGLSVINARYILFLDSDDCLAPGAIENLLNAAYKYNVDIVEGSYRRRSLEGKLFGGERREKAGVSIRECISGYPWMKVIKADLFQNICFPERYWFEDTIMGMLVLPLAKSFATIKEDVYYYTYNTQSISFTARKNPKCIDSFYITRTLLKDAQKCGALETAPLYAYHHFLQQVRNNWYRTLCLGKVVEQAMFVLSCDLRDEYFSFADYKCEKKNLKNMENALQTRNFEKFRKTCIVDF